MDKNHINMFFLLLFIISLFPVASSLSKLAISKTMNNLKQNNTNSTNVNPNTNNINRSPNDFFKIYGPCLPKNCQGPYAYCVNPTVCECFHGYANYKDSSNTTKSDLYCQYVQKSQLTAFLFELFVPIGVGHFYANRITVGVIKLVLAIMFCLIYATIKYHLHPDNKSDLLINNDNQDTDNTEIEKYLAIIFCLLCCSLFVWQIVDLVMFGINKYPDGNNVPLASW